MTAFRGAKEAISVERFRPAALGPRSLEVAVVIDVLRATSTATVLLHRGSLPIRVVERAVDLPTIKTSLEMPGLVFSELSEISDRVDNSPVLAQTVALEGRTPILITTNGTRAMIAAASRAQVVLIASFLNLSSIAAHIAQLDPQTVTLLPAGDFVSGTPHIEDERCAEVLSGLIRGELVDIPKVTAECRSDARILRRMAVEGFGRDLDLSLTLDLCPVVMSFTSDAPSRGWITRL